MNKINHERDHGMDVDQMRRLRRLLEIADDDEDDEPDISAGARYKLVHDCAMAIADMHKKVVINLDQHPRWPHISIDYGSMSGVKHGWGTGDVHIMVEFHLDLDNKTTHDVYQVESYVAIYLSPPDTDEDHYAPWGEDIVRRAMEIVGDIDIPSAHNTDIDYTTMGQDESVGYYFPSTAFKGKLKQLHDSIIRLASFDREYGLHDLKQLGSQHRSGT